MSRRAVRAASVVVFCAGGVAACSAATPPFLTPTLPPGATSSAAVSPAERPMPSPGAGARDGLGAELDVGEIDSDLTGEVLEFASTGRSVVYSSGLLEDAGEEAAPDVFRYVPGPSAAPELVWRNPSRDHSVVRVGGDLDTIAFVDVPLSGERAWDLWLVADGAAPVRLDTHPGGEDISSLVPSLSVFEPRIAWTAFDRGATGPVSQLLVAEAPGWEPRVLLERPAAEAELWLPSLHGNTLVFSEIRYSDGRSTDERTVHLLELGIPDAEPRRLDASGRATMAVASADSVLWKETDPGFNMFNWGRMFEYDLATATISSISTWPQEFVNYPSAGSRFVAWWGADAFSFGVYDLVRDRARLIERHSSESQANVLRPHVSGDLLVWMHVETPPGAASHRSLRYAYLPNAGADR